MGFRQRVNAVSSDSVYSFGTVARILQRTWAVCAGYGLQLRQGEIAFAEEVVAAGVGDQASGFAGGHGAAIGAMETAGARIAVVNRFWAVGG